MSKVWLLALAVTLAAANQGWAQSTPSVFTNPNIDFALIRKATLVPFTSGSTVQDPFGATKASVYLTSALKSRGYVLVDFADLVRRIQADTGQDFSGPATEDGLKVFLAEAPKHVDALLFGYVTAWGTITQTGTQAVAIPVQGWIYGSGGVWQWRTTQYVPVQRNREASVVGTTVALASLLGGGPLVLAWQFSQVRTDTGGPFRWNRPAPPDQLAERLFQDVARTIPLRP